MALRKFAEGREAGMYACEDGTVLRLLRDPDAECALEREAVAMRAARSCGLPVPEVRGTTVVMGRPGLLMERIHGADLLALVGSRPWTVVRAARLCGQVHARLHEVVAPKSMPALRGALRERIASSPRVPPPLVRFALDALARLPDGDRLCHGDFHMGNVMMVGSVPVLIDWTHATRGDPTADVARTRLMSRLGELPPGTSTLLRILTPLGRDLFGALYLRSYRRLRPVDVALMGRWKTPVAAARLADGIESEGPGLVRMLERAAARAL